MRYKEKSRREFEAAGGRNKIRSFNFDQLYGLSVARCAYHTATLDGLVRAVVIMLNNLPSALREHPASGKTLHGTNDTSDAYVELLDAEMTRQGNYAGTISRRLIIENVVAYGLLLAVSTDEGPAVP